MVGEIEFIKSTDINEKKDNITMKQKESGDYIIYVNNLRNEFHKEISKTYIELLLGKINFESFLIFQILKTPQTKIWYSL